KPGQCPTISPSTISAVSPLRVTPQAAGFTSASVTLTASYANPWAELRNGLEGNTGRSIFRIVTPQEVPMSAYNATNLRSNLLEELDVGGHIASLCGLHQLRGNVDLLVCVPALPSRSVQLARATLQLFFIRQDKHCYQER